ncbi:hypothetical protein [Paludibacterium sp. THUN1379]|uniref:hypothetical protein n=1 Tax=Paludibacterium sp. THUN1379 TaxID=3112107 RepID=UPI0030CC08A4
MSCPRAAVELAIWLRQAQDSAAPRCLQQAEAGDLPCVTASQCAVDPGSPVLPGLRLGGGHRDEDEMQRCLGRLRVVLAGRAGGVTWPWDILVDDRSN